MSEQVSGMEAMRAAKDKLSPFGMAVATLLSKGDAGPIINSFPAQVRKLPWWPQIANVYRTIGDLVVHLPPSERLSPESTVFALTSGDPKTTIPAQLQPLTRQAIATTGLVSWMVQGYHTHEVQTTHGGVWKWSKSPIPRLGDVATLGLVVIGNPANGKTNGQVERAVYEASVVNLLATNAQYGLQTAYLPF